MAAHLVLYKDNRCIIFLSGELLVDESIRLASLHLRSPNVIDAPAPVRSESFGLLGADLTIPRPFLERLTPAGDEYRLVTPDAEVSLQLSASLVVTNNQTANFLGLSFSVEAGFSASFMLRLPIRSDPNPQPDATIECCGYVIAATSDDAFSSAPLCLQVDLDELFGKLPNLNLPSLQIDLPDFGFPLPRLRFPWTFPVPLRFPFTLPSHQVSLGKLPVGIGWKSAQIDLDDRVISLDLFGLRIDGDFGAIEGDLHVVWTVGRLNPGESFFHLYKPDFRNLLRLQLSQWFFDEDCLLITWQKGQVNEWLGLLLPDLAEIVEADTDITLRVLRDEGELHEIRLDWVPESERALTLPGFEVTLPPQTQFSLIYYRTDAAGRLAFVVTEEANRAIIAESSIAFGRPADRELLASNVEPFIKFEAIPSEKTSVALLDVELSSKASIKFFQQLTTMLGELKIEEFTLPPESDGETLDLPELPRFCSPTELDLKSLEFNTWQNSKLHVNLPKIDLPFLQNGTGQLIEVRRKNDFESFNFKADGITIEFDVTIHLAPNFALESELSLVFDWERFAVKIDDDKGVEFKVKGPQKGNLLGLKWTFTPNKDNVLFVLVTQGRNYQFRKASGSQITAELPQFGASGESLCFDLRNFDLTPAGISAIGQVSASPIKLGGLNTKFRFTEGYFKIIEGKIQNFTISGSGALPPKLVGEATADIDLHFGTKDGKLNLTGGGAELRGNKLLHCQATRFEFTVNELGLKFDEDGRYHFYFTVTGSARFVPQPGDNASGPLAWLPGIDMQLRECPLTDDLSVLGKHVTFLVDMPSKPTFDFLGCFKMELRGIGFIPQAPEFGGEAAMTLSGQLLFAQGTGDEIEAKFDFHQLLIGLPEPGQSFPRIHFKGLGVKIRIGDAFALEGSVDFFDKDPIEPGLLANGFAGSGSLSIQNFLTATATFTFIRVSRDGGHTFVRAWFIYIQAEKLSIRIPVLDVFIREIGLGFGYRYTLASIRSADELDDPRALIKELKRLSLSQGELGRRDQWRVDLEEPGQDPRWTIAARLMIAQASAAKGFFDYNQQAEAVLASVFLLDVVLGIRSDLTILMTVRAWLNTNYEDYRAKESLRTRPLMSGFVLFSPRQRRFLAHFASNPGAEFGDHPPIPDFLKEALRNSYFSATLLMEPGLLHYELGWPNQLRWSGKLGPINAEFTGGTIFRISRTDIVYGTSFLARGTLELAAQVGGGSVGARISAVANVAYGARYIGVIGLQDPLGRSALYGAVGIEINVRFAVEFWLKIKVAFVKINIHLRFEFSVQITALVEVGFTPGKLLGASGTATVMLSIMGRSLHFKVHVGVNQGAVDEARRITSQYLNIGLEATEAEPIPGTTDRESRIGPSTGSTGTPGGGQPAAASIASSNSEVTISREGASTTTVEQPVEAFVAPNYSIFKVMGKDSNHYFLLYPNELQPDEKTRQGFLALPPKPETAVNHDYEWMLPPLGENVTLEQFDTGSNDWQKVIPSNLVEGRYQWKVDWEQDMGSAQPALGGPAITANSLKLRGLLQQAYLNEPFLPETDPEYFNNFTLVNDPDVPPRQTVTAEDQRVYNPSEAAFESAVRGAAEQFEGSPNFKRDVNSSYEANLASAFANGTSIYADKGQKSAQDTDTPTEVTPDEKTEQAIHLRSVIVNEMLTDVQQYAETPDDPSRVDVVRSVAFQAGLVFRIRIANGAPLPDWLRKPVGAGTIRQRTRQASSDPDSKPRDVRLFNVEGTGFTESTPQFQRVRQYTDANTIAITWDLVWSDANRTKADLAGLKAHLTAYSPDQNPENDLLKPDHFLKHYLIQRRDLSGNEPEMEFKVKPVQVLNLPSVRGQMKVSFEEHAIQYKPGGLNVFDPGQKVQVTIGSETLPLTIGSEPEDVRPDRIQFNPFAAIDFGVSPQEEYEVTLHDDKIRMLRPRFQFTDNFNHEPLRDQAALSREGKTYLYTIIPVDVTGAHSLRPLTVVATRRASLPPAVPAGSELQINYLVRAEDFEPTEQEPAEPTVFDPTDTITLSWTKPAKPAGQPAVLIAAYRLVFRKEKTLPIGFYGLDSGSEGNRNDGLPSTNARHLPTDVIVQLKRNRAVEFTDSTTKEKKLFISLPPAELKGVFPGSGQAWRPEAWQVFLQTEGASGVRSALVPIKVILRFMTTVPVGAPAGFQPPAIERQPALLEFMTRPVRRGMVVPEDEKAAVGFAAFPMPNQNVENPLAEGIGVAQLVAFRRHPEALRAVQLTWNQSPGAQVRYPVNLQAGYQLYEFDLDARTADVLNQPLPDFLNQLRRIQEVQLLSPSALTLTPDNASVANQWEAWYPSMVRRLSERVDNEPVSSSEARLSSWFSWRESYLDWVNDQAILTAASVTIRKDEQLGRWVVAGVTDRQAGFKAGQFVRIIGARNPGNNGLKQTSPDQSGLPGELHFVDGSFVTDPVEVETGPVTIDLNPEPGLHPWLNQLIKRLEADETVSVDVNPLPKLRPDSLDMLQRQTDPQQDPYGWNILKLMGLSVAFVLRDRLTGQALPPDELQKRLRETLADQISVDAKESIKRHLFVEFLFQPARSVSLDQRPTELAEKDLLSLVQISLRPLARQYYRYWIHRINGPVETNRPVTITFSSVRSIDFIELSRNGALPIRIEPEGQNHQFKTAIQIPPSGEAILLFRMFHSSSDVIPPHIDDKPAEPFIQPDAWPIYFEAPVTDWAEAFQHDSQVAGAWQRFRAYLLRLNATLSLAHETKIDVPPLTETEKIAGLLTWLNRFFDAGADFVTNPDNLFGTGKAVNVATAYPRVMFPTALTPDAAKRLTYFHRFSDAWAHVYRYYVLPAFRYDRLWEALAGSDELFPDEKPKLDWFAPPESEAGGLDVVIDRVKEVAAPLVLFSGRVDEKTSEAVPPKPGKTWEVIIAKHPEQRLIERNQTLKRQLDFRQQAHALSRRFAFGKELDILIAFGKNPLLGQTKFDIDPHPTPATTSVALPGPIAKPIELNPAEIKSFLPGLLDRLGAPGQEAVVLQLESLPFYYEHLLELIAQASTRVSPVTRLIQREFEYVSPVPAAQYEAYDPGNSPRVLRLPIDLKNYWASLPKDVQARWPSEDPDRFGEDLGFAALPDAGVVYQVSVTDPVQNVETQAEFFFDLAVTGGTLPYKVRQIGKRLKGTPLTIERTGKQFQLQTHFDKPNSLTFPKPVPLSDRIIPPNTQETLPTGDVTLASYQEQLFRLFPTLAPLREPDASAEELVFRLRMYTALTVFRESFGQLETVLDKITLLRKDDLSFLAATAPLNTQERQVLLAVELPEPDQAELVKFCDQIENRQVVETFFRDWMSEQAVSSRHAFGPALDRIEFPAPQSCVLTLDAAGADRDALRLDLEELLRQPRDNSFANAVQLLIEQLTLDDANQKRFSVEAGVGLEQIREITTSERFTIDPNKRRLIWKGILTELQLQALERWRDTSDFRATIKSLVDETRDVVFRIPYPASTPDAPSVPPVLAGHLRVDQVAENPALKELVWENLQVSFKAERALKRYREAVEVPGLNEALDALSQELTSREVAVRIQEPDWQPRPSQRELPNSLRDRLLIGNGLMQFWGWMTPGEGGKLMEGQLRVDQQAIRQLYNQSMKRGLNGSTLQLIARRGSADNNVAMVSPKPLT